MGGFRGTDRIAVRTHLSLWLELPAVLIYIYIYKRWIQRLRSLSVHHDWIIK